MTKKILKIIAILALANMLIACGSEEDKDANNKKTNNNFPQIVITN